MYFEITSYASLVEHKRGAGQLHGANALRQAALAYGHRSCRTLGPLKQRLRMTGRSLLITILLCTSVAAVLAQPSVCRLEPFQGATSPQGAVALMHVVNTGATCSITNYGVPVGRGNPADSGSITSQPSHGSAEFTAPQAKYTPAPGYVGDDEFAYEAYARGSINQQLRLKVRVKVQVVAP